MNMSFFIYKITNILDNKIYIGKTNDLQKRWYNHLYCAFVIKRKTYFYNAIRKYSIKNFSVEILEECDDEQYAFEKEIYWIKTLNSNDQNIGYNLTNGGEGVSELIRSEKSKQLQQQKMSGRKLSDEHKRKISQGNMGKILSFEACKNISKSKLGENNGMYGKTIKEETRKKLSNFQSKRIRKPLSEEHKEKNRLSALNQNFSFRIPINIKNEIIQLYATNNYTKKQLSEKFQLKYNSIVKIIRSHKIV